MRYCLAMPRHRVRSHWLSGACSDAASEPSRNDAPFHRRSRSRSAIKALLRRGETKISDQMTIRRASGQTPPALTQDPITIGQMYVQFQIPQKIKGPGWPVIMVHGSRTAAPRSSPRPTAARAGTQTRPQGVAINVVDPAGRGRSGFDQSVLHEARAKALAAMRPVWPRCCRTSNGSATPMHGGSGSVTCCRPVRRSRPAGASRTATQAIRSWARG